MHKLLPKPKKRRLGRWGSEARYPPGTEKLVLILHRAGRERRSVKWMALHAWLAGFPRPGMTDLPLSDLARRALVDLLLDEEHTLRTSRTLDEQGILPNLVTSASRRLKVSGVRLTQANRSEIAALLCDVFLGTLTKDRLADYWHLFRTVDLFPQLPAPLRGEASALFLNLSREASIPRILGALQEMKPEEFDQLRTETLWLWNVLPEIGWRTDVKFLPSVWLLVFVVTRVSPTWSALYHSAVAKLHAEGVHTRRQFIDGMRASAPVASVPAPAAGKDQKATFESRRGGA